MDMKSTLIFPRMLAYSENEVLSRVPRGMHPNSQANLNRFSSAYQPANAGRKPSRFKKFIKENNVSNEDLGRLIRNVLFSYSEEKLNDLEEDERTPRIVRTFIHTFKNDMKNGNLKNVEILLNRAFGAPAQKIEMNGGLEISNSDPILRQERIRELLDKREAEKNVTPVESHNAVD